MHQVLGAHSILITEIWLFNNSLRKLKKLLAHFAQAKHFITGREIDKEVADGFFHGEEVGNKHFDYFYLDKLVKDKKSFFQHFCKAILITGHEKTTKVFNTLSFKTLSGSLRATYEEWF